MDGLLRPNHPRLQTSRLEGPVIDVLEKATKGDSDSGLLKWVVARAQEGVREALASDGGYGCSCRPGADQGTYRRQRLNFRDPQFERVGL
jgi:hypothetical protein